MVSQESIIVFSGSVRLKLIIDPLCSSPLTFILFGLCISFARTDLYSLSPLTIKIISLFEFKFLEIFLENEK